MKEATRKAIKIAFDALKALAMLATGPYGWVIRGIVTTGIADAIAIWAINATNDDKDHAMQQEDRDVMVAQINTAKARNQARKRLKK